MTPRSTRIFLPADPVGDTPGFYNLANKDIPRAQRWGGAASVEEIDMRTTRRMMVIGTPGVLGLSLLLLGSRPPAPLPLAVFSPAPPPRSAAEGALRRAAQYRTRAKIAVSEQRGELEAWDPQASAAMDVDSWRLQQLALDRDGFLRQARRWVRQATLMARTRADVYQAAELQVLLDHETGDHDAELREAQRLIALAPGSSRARMVLRRAEVCYRCRGGRAGAPGPSPSDRLWTHDGTRRD